MLVLSRKIGEAIQIGPDIIVKVVGMIGDKVKLGIEAPRSISVHRQEVANLLKNTNQANQESSSEAAELPY